VSLLDAKQLTKDDHQIRRHHSKQYCAYELLKELVKGTHLYRACHRKFLKRNGED
jgi:hypothetical protein